MKWNKAKTDNVSISHREVNLQKEILAGLAAALGGHIESNVPILLRTSGTIVESVMNLRLFSTIESYI